MARVAKSRKPSMKADSLLVELRTEELPPKSLRRLGEVFAEGMEKALRDAHLLTDASATTPFATPRRLAVRVTGVLAQQPDREQNRQGPKQGAPAQAVEGFARGLGVSVDKLSVQDGRYAYTVKIKGESLAKLVPEFVVQALKALPIPKLMRWGDGEAQFVRPVHGLILMHGSKVIPGTVLGIKSGNKTLGHRFLSNGPITISHADKYADILRKSGSVIANFDERRDKIVGLLNKAAQRNGRARFINTSYRDRTGNRLDIDIGFNNPNDSSSDSEREDVLAGAAWILKGNQELIDEVTSLVEWPVVYEGEFDEAFLNIPAQCIGLTMQKNQKYFALVSEQAVLLPKYLIISNLETAKPANIIDGNARVLRARLSDARFFFDQDCKARLDSRVPRLANVVYHNKLGSQLERVERIQKLAGEIARRLNADVATTERAAYLAKADLLTDMVGEFPELQGVMGYYYARHDSEDPAVAGACIEHYQPRFAGDAVPRSPVGVCVALADKLDTLVGIYGIGLVPTGDKDPFGLRRQALGLIRILVETKLKFPSLDVVELLQLARSQFPAGIVAESVAQDLHGFLLERLKPYFREKGFESDVIDAVISQNSKRFDKLPNLLTHVKAYFARPEAKDLAEINKRVLNIIKKNREEIGWDFSSTPIERSLLKEQAEINLYAAIESVAPILELAFKKEDYGTYFDSLVTLKPVLSNFFDKGTGVLVMHPQQEIRINRAKILQELGRLMNRVADISRLQS